MSRTMLRVRSIVGALLLVTAVWIEINFDRPSLSVRPQVWLSRPVAWTFRTQSLLAGASIEPSTSALILTLTDFGFVFDRFKNGSTEPMWSPIQSEVLFTTLTKMNLESVGVRISADRSGEIIDLGESLTSLDFTDGRGVIAVRSSDSSEQLVATVGSLVTFELMVSVGRCAPRESFVACPLADFSGADLSRGDFERANLRGADISWTKFVEAKLTFADLSGAIGRNVDMSGALLIGIDISGAYLEDVNYGQAVWVR